MYIPKTHAHTHKEKRTQACACIHTQRERDLKPFLLRKGIHPLVEKANIFQIRS